MGIPEDLLEVVVRAADDKLAKDIMVLDMKNLSVITDYNVITHGSNNRQINAIANGVIQDAAEAGFDVRSIEGKQGGNWVLVDLGDVIFHVFDEEERAHYQIESLWTEAPSVDISEWVTE
jgi:ribosome-associated protein